MTFSMGVPDASQSLLKFSGMISQSRNYLEDIERAEQCMLHEQFSTAIQICHELQRNSQIPQHIKQQSQIISGYAYKALNFLNIIETCMKNNLKELDLKRYLHNWQWCIQTCDQHLQMFPKNAEVRRIHEIRGNAFNSWRSFSAQTNATKEENYWFTISRFIEIGCPLDSVEQFYRAAENYLELYPRKTKIRIANLLMRIYHIKQTLVDQLLRLQAHLLATQIRAQCEQLLEAMQVILDNEEKRDFTAVRNIEFDNLHSLGNYLFSKNYFESVNTLCTFALDNLGLISPWLGRFQKLKAHARDHLFMQRYIVD